MVAPGRVGMHGCSGGVCVVAPGGHAWLLWGACMVAPGGACMVFAGGAWFFPGGHVWFLPVGVCVVFYLGGMRGFSRGSMHRI